MIGAVLALPLIICQLAAAPLVVRDAHRTVRIPTVASAAGVMVRPDALAGMLPITVRHDSAAYYTIEVWGARLQVQAGTPLVRIGGETQQLASAVSVQHGHLLVPRAAHLRGVSENGAEYAVGSGQRAARCVRVADRSGRTDYGPCASDRGIERAEARRRRLRSGADR